MARVLVWAQGRQYEVDVPGTYDPAEVARALAGEWPVAADVDHWLTGNPLWIPTRDGGEEHGRVRRETISGIWVES